MSKCIDVFHTPSRRAYTYITFVIDDNGAVISSNTHNHIGEVVAWCKRQQLPARSNSADVQEELRSHGVKVRGQAFRSDKALDEDKVIIDLPREQANFLRQFLTTMREWGENGRPMSMMHYLFASNAIWLDEFDRELARSLGKDVASDDDEPCATCHGTGICPICGGAGWVSNKERCTCNNGKCWCGTPVRATGVLYQDTR
jgi:hypothetical protein